MSLYDLDHESAPEGTGGPTISMWDSITGSFEAQHRVYSPLSRQAEVQDAWEENLRVLERLTGEQFNMPQTSPFEGPSLSVLQAYLQQTETGSHDYNLGPLGFSDEDAFAPFKAADARIAELGNPEVKSFAQIVQQVNETQREIVGASEEISERGSFIGELLGGMAGTFTGRDPLSIYTMSWGGAGRGLVTKIGGEMAVAAGVVGASDIAYVNPNLAAAGLPERDPYMDILYGALGAGVLRGGFEAAGAGMRAAGGAFDRQLPDIDLDFSDNAVRQVLDENIQSPTARAGLNILDDTQMFETANPFGNTAAGSRQFTADLNEIYNLMSGRTSTAMGQVIGGTAHTVPNVSLDRTVARERTPWVYAKLDETEARLAELDEQIEAARGVVDALETPSSTVITRETFQPTTGTELNLAEVSQTVATTVEEALRSGKKVTYTVEGKEVPIVAVREGLLFDTQEQPWGILPLLQPSKPGANKLTISSGEQAVEGAERTLVALQAERRQTQAVYNDVRNVADRQEAAVAAERVAQEQALGKTAPSRSGPVDDTLNPERLRPDVLEQLERDVTAGADALPETSAAIQASMRMPDGKIDLGNGMIVDPTFKVFDDNGDLITADAFATRLEEDEAMVKAMTECSL